MIYGKITENLLGLPLCCRFRSKFISDSQPDLFQHCISDLYHMHCLKQDAADSDMAIYSDL